MGHRRPWVASWLVAATMAKVTPKLEALQPAVATPRTSTSPLMPDGTAALTAENLFPPRSCDMRLCIGQGDCDETCDRLKSTFKTTIPGKGLGFYHSTKQIPFDGRRQPKIKVGIIVTSGILRDAELQICRILNAVVRNYGSLEAAMEEVMIVSPHWQTVSKLGESIGAVPEDELAWSSRPPNADEDYGGFPEDPNDLKGWAVGANSTGEDSISSFEVMDQLVRALVDPAVHPNMEKVMIVGHGEGGSFVQRYAMFTRVDVQGSIHMSFHVANPSVLLYLFDDRPLQPKKATCAQNDNYTISHWKWNFQPLRNSSYREYMGEDCVGRANTYPYGLDGALPLYVNRTWKGDNRLDNIRKAYAKKHVTLYSGQSDTCNKELHEALSCAPTDCELPDMFLESTCSAMHQGPNRMARAMAYMQATNSDGDLLVPNHNLVRVDGVGHSSCYMYQSRAMRLSMFGAESPSPPSPPPSPPIVPGALGPLTPTWPITAPAALFLLVVAVLVGVLCYFASKGVDFAVDEFVTKPRQRLGVPCGTGISRMVAERKRNGGQTLASDVYAALPPHDSLVDLLPMTEAPAIRSPDPARPTCTHARLRKFIQEEVPVNFGQFGITSGERVAVIVPNGTEAVGTTLALLSYVLMVPINIASVEEEIVQQLEQCRCTSLLLLAGATVPNEVCLRAAKKLGLCVLEAKALPEAAGLFRIERALNAPRAPKDPPTPCRPEDPVLILLTSGTTGKKKIVPHALKDCIAGATTLAVGQDLSPTDACCNAMPLFHVGGIMRCVLSPVLSGGSVVPMAYFDADWFLANVTAHQCSWYYASPTIHQSILDAFHRKPVPHRLRLIANAAAPLPPTLAVKMRETYSAPGRRCVLMPSYGMTECMPISAPPHDYNLERPGSSGRQLGPQLEIHTAEGAELPRGQVGHIALKGPPVMQGYEGGDGSEFINGWFHTGDNGYIDDEGNLYVVARTKEAINRGGETIIPAEVEAALATHPAIKSICCFATPHATLQETVGCMVVPAFGYSRITLNQLTKHASQYLHSSKWPAVLVYGTAMPLNATGKLVRVKLAERMSIATVDDETPEGERVYEMLGAPSKAPQEPIPVKPVVVKAPAKGSQDWLDNLKKRLSVANASDNSPTEKALLDLYTEVRPTADRDELTVDDDLILLGTSSIQMGELGSKIRRRFGVGLPPTVMFAPPRSLRSISASIDEKLELASTDMSTAMSTTSKGDPEGGPENPDPPRSRNSAGFFPMVVQSIPSLMFKALGRTSSFTLLMLLFVQTHNDFCDDLQHDLPVAWNMISSCSTLHFLLCIWVTHTILSLVLPCFAILTKWTLIGRYKPGMYPLWGHYYLRWWFVTRVVDACGIGPLFRYNNWWRCWYFRLLGAKVGQNVKISPGAQLSEWDLLSIGDGVVIDAAVLSPFAAQAGAMVLKPITMAQLSGVGVSSVLGPGDSLPYGVVLGPLSCGLEANNSALEAVSKHHRNLVRPAFPEPSQLKQWLIGVPCILFVNFMHALPYISCLFFVLIQFSRVELGSTALVAKWSERAMWLVTPWRLMALLLAITTRNVVSPWFKFFSVVLVKRVIIGRFRAGPKGDWEHLQYWLTQKLTAKDGPLCGIHAMLGKHHFGVSWALRLLGVNVGKRVFWPGVELKIVEFDLLTVGDDVVFGSRGYVLCGDCETNAPVTLAAGANVADRCVLLPGCVVERNAVLGSGSLGKAHTSYPRGCTAIGSVAGDCVLLHPGNKHNENEDDVPYSAPVPGIPDTGGPDTIKPFGKVFYGSKANSWKSTPPASAFMLYGVAVAALGPAFRSAVWLLALYVSTHAMDFENPDMNAAKQDNNLGHIVILRHIGTMLGYCILFQLCAQPIAVALGVAYKWRVIGLRKEGGYNWDISSYNARWKLYTAVQFIDLGAIGGTIYIVWWYKLLGCTIGKNCCLWPAGSDLFLTEPDLVTMGEGVCLNKKSGVVCHLNSRGGFTLTAINLGDRASCRALTKVTGGSGMGDDSLLLEHTLLMPGEKLGSGETRQGWIALEQ